MQDPPGRHDTNYCWANFFERTEDFPENPLLNMPFTGEPVIDQAIINNFGEGTYGQKISEKTHQRRVHKAFDSDRASYDHVMCMRTDRQPFYRSFLRQRCTCSRRILFTCDHRRQSLLCYHSGHTGAYGKSCRCG